MSLCQNRWRKHGQQRTCELPAIGRFEVAHDSQYPRPPISERSGVGQHFVVRSLCKPCAGFLSVRMVGEVR